MQEQAAMRPKWLGSIRAAALADPLFGGQVAGILAGLAVAGIVAGAAAALLVGRAWAAPVGGGLLIVALALGAGTVALLLRERQHLQHLRRAQHRFYGALAALCLGVVIAAAALTPWPLVVAGVGSVVAAAAIWFSSRWARRAAERVVWQAAHGRREAWLAQLRAARLTRRMIGYAAYKQLRRDGFLPVQSAIYPQRTYQIPLRTTPSGARILVLEHGRPIGGLCLRPREPLPDPEEALTHILAIRNDERAWLNRANFFPHDRELTPQALGLAPGRPGNYDR